MIAAALEAVHFSWFAVPAGVLALAKARKTWWEGTLVRNRVRGHEIGQSRRPDMDAMPPP